MPCIIVKCITIVIMPTCASVQSTCSYAADCAHVHVRVCRASEVRARRRAWGPGDSLAEAMMGILGEDAMMGGFEGRLPHAPAHMAGHRHAMRAAFAGITSGRLPPHLLFSDRDFNEDDYEALLALDETVENRKGECLCCALCLICNCPAMPDQL